jgi:hypothetical protein
MGHQSSTAKRSLIRYEQRNDLGNPNGATDDRYDIHHFGQQHRWLKPYLNITVNDQMPGPFDIPENNTLTNNTYVHLEPDFINITTGNGSTWSTTPTGYQLTTSFHGDVPCLNQTYNGTIYASYNAKLHGYGIANNTLWLINNTIESVGCDTYFSWPSSTGYTQSVSHSYGTSLYFTGIDGSDRNLYGYGMENGTIWVESTADPGMWSMMVDDVMYFFGETGNSGYELHGHNLSNGTTWMLDDLFSGSGSITGPTLTNNWPVLVGSTFVFGAVFTNSSTSRETWAHNISNGTSWRLSTNDASTHNAPVLGDVVYFTNNNGFWNELHAYNASNETFWKVVAGPFGGPFEVDGILYGYVPSPYSSQPSKLRAHNPANGTTWDAAVPGSLHLLNMGGTLYYAGSLTGTNNLQLWAYEPTNSTGWKVSDLTIPFSVSMNWVFIALGDVIYFTASNGTTSGLWAHSSSNHSTWFVSNLFSSNNAAAVAVVNGTLYLGNSGMAGHQPASINYQTNTGGAVTSWAINASLPSGLTFSTTNGSIYGTPTELWTQTSYMVWANNSGGQSVAYLNITVVDELPTLSYSPENLTLTKGQSSTDLPLSATLTGPGTITSWAISPALPSGLSFGTSNGTIWGTPTSLMSLKTFTIWANNSGGWSSATVNITVNDEAPDISYNPDWFVLTNNTAMSPTATPTNSGGAVPSTVIDSTGDVGEYSSIVIDSYGFKHISYFDATNTKLKYATDKSGSWVHTTVNTNTQMGKYTSIAIDSEGYVHISYDYYSMSYNHLMYATDKSGSWVNTIADGSAEVGSHTSIAVDSNDAVHISYYDATNTNLKYATCSSSCSSASSWSKVTIESSSGDVGKYNSIAIDSNDTLHISYRDSTNGDLKYATCSSSCTSASSWTRSTIDSDGNVGSRTSIAIDSNGAVHISYYDITNGDLKYATDQSGSWANTTVDSVGTVGKYSSIAIDANDVVHISYYDATNKDLKYASNMQSYIQTGVGNVIKFIDRDTKVGNEGTSIAVDSNGDVHISYYDDINGDLKYAALQGVHPWNVYGYSISPDLPAGLSLNIATGEISGTPTALSSNTTYTITARNTGGTNTTTITIEVLDQLPTLSYSPENLTLTKGQSSTDLPLSATLTGPGTITSWAISPALPSGLSFGTSNGTIWGTPTSLMPLKTFRIWANNSGGSVNATVNITVNDEAPDISYSPDWFVLTNNTAMSPTATPTNSGGAVPSTVIDSTVGFYSSIAIDSNGYKHISYYDETNKVLKYATDKTGSWVNISVDTAGFVGYWTSIAIDSNDAVHISYQDNANDNLKYATCASSCSSASSWTTTSVDWPGTVGSYTSIAIDSNDAVHISYYDDTNKELKYATCASSCSSASSWTKISVDSDIPAHVGYYTSIAIDSNDAVHISYYVAINQDLKYATCASSCSSASSWTTTSVVTTGDVGSFTSIAIDSNDAVHISYYDGTNDDLKYATCASSCSSASSWTTTSVDTTGNVGIWTSIAIDSNDAVHISYYDTTNKDLKYATCASSCSSASSWTTTSVDTTGIVGPYTSIAIDSNDAVHISYRDATNSDLKYAVLDSSSNIYGYSISPDLPAGLSLNIATGEISGTPTTLSSNTTYTITARNSGGVNTTTITIEVLDQLPGLSYSPENLTLTNNTASTDLPLAPTITGSGEIVTWAISPSEPSGLSFDTSTGVLSGTPTELLTRTMYTITATNTGGNATAYINITIVDEVPTIAYSPNDLDLTNNTASTDLPLAPTITGSGEIVTWAISPSEPSGLSFDTSTGVLSGTPTELLTRTMFTITATNTGGNATAYINITIVDEVPTIAYSPENLTLTKGLASTDLPLTPTLTGSGAITSWAISPALPSGLSFGTSNGTIWGIATVLQTSPVTYTVRANNSGGSDNATINITINDQAPNISYSPNELNLTKYLSSSDLPLSPTNTGGNTQTTALCSSSGTPHLFVVSDHEGTRHVLCGTTLYSIDLNGTQTVSTNHVTGTAFALEIDDDGYLHIGHWTYNYPYVYIHHATNKNGSWQSSNVFNFSYGGSVGYDSQGFSMAVGSDDSIHFTYIQVTSAGNSNNLYHLSNQSGSWSSALLTNSGKPSAPSLALNDDNVPHVAFTAGNSFSVGKYESGSYTTLLSRSNYIEPDIVIDAQGDVHMVYRKSSYSLYYSTNASGSWQHTTLDSTARHFDVRIALDSNEYPHVMTASVSGQNNNYRLVNYYSHDGSSWNGGSITSEINLQQPRPDLFVDDNDVISMVYHDGTYANLFTGTGSTTYGYSISPALPSGLHFSQSTGTISGIATVQMNRTMFTITANNSGGSSTAYINITVNDRMPSFTYSPENLTLTNNTVSSDLPLVPTVPNTADAPTEWVLMGTLPAGLNFGSNNGTIWGTATELWTTTNYTVYGNNTGGSFNASINITVNDEVPTIVYSPNDLNMTNNTASLDLPLSPTITGSGEIVSPGPSALQCQAVCPSMSRRERSVERRQNC